MQWRSEEEGLKTEKTVALALLIALAMVLSYLESLIPYSFAVPGIRMGLPNIVIIFALYRIGWKESAAISFIRIGLTAVLFGNLFSLIYSVCGAALSLTVMPLLKKSGRFQTVGVSISGAVMHNIGQILAAFFILNTSGIIFYLPMLLLSGVLSGMLIGIAGSVCVKRIPGNFS